MKFTAKNLLDMYRLNHMIRYNTTPHIMDESVASHSYYVSLFTMMLCEELELDSGFTSLALQAALVHDMPEIVVNDITHDAKSKMPMIDKILKHFEEQFIGENFPEQFATLFSDTHIAKKVMLIVKLADILSVYQYSLNETMMGNNNFSSFVSDTEERLIDCKLKLEKAGLCKNKTSWVDFIDSMFKGVKNYAKKQ